jgi:hypothetical protein
VVVLAVRMMRPQRISVTRMWVSPIILCALTAWVIYANNMLNPAPPLEIALGVVVGGIVGLPFGILRGVHTDVRPTDRPGVMYLGSSWVTIVIFAAAFGLRYHAPSRKPHCDNRRRAARLRDRLYRGELFRHLPKVRRAGA